MASGITNRVCGIHKDESSPDGHDLKTETVSSRTGVSLNPGDLTLNKGDVDYANDFKDCVWDTSEILFSFVPWCPIGSLFPAPTGRCPQRQSIASSCLHACVASVSQVEGKGRPHPRQSTESWIAGSGSYQDAKQRRSLCPSAEARGWSIWQTQSNTGRRYAVFISISLGQRKWT